VHHQVSRPVGVTT